MHTVITISVVNSYYIPHFFDGIDVSKWNNNHQTVVIPEPYQAGEPEDICVWAGLDQKWAVKRRMTIQPFYLPSDLWS